MAFAEQGLIINKKHMKSWYKKGKALAYLARFGESCDIFEMLGLKKEVATVLEQKELASGGGPFDLYNNKTAPLETLLAQQLEQ